MLSEEEKKAIKILKEDIEVYKEKGVWKENSIFIKSLRTILNLIEKQNKIIVTNKENWLLVQNEVLGYAQGYEDGKQHKQTETAMVVENRKYQIIGEEIKRYKAIIEKQQAEIEKKDKIIDLMAEYIEEIACEGDLDNLYAELYNCNGLDRNWTRGKEAEVADIKKYFTNKVEKEGEENE